MPDSLRFPRAATLALALAACGDDPVRPHDTIAPLQWTEMQRGIVFQQHAICLGGSSASDVFVVDYFGGVGRYDGTRWSQRFASDDTAIGSFPRGCWGSSSSDIFAISASTIAHFDGNAWQRFPVTGNQLRVISGRSPGDVWAAGQELLHYDGSEWTRMLDSTAVPYALSALWPSAPGVVILGAADGRVYRFQNGALTPLGQPGPYAIGALWGASTTDLFAVDGAGKVFRYNGSQWAPQTEMFAQGRAIWGTSSSDVWVGGDGGLVHYDGTSWTWETTPKLSYVGQVSHLWGNSSSNAWLLAGGGVIRHFDGGGWATHPPSVFRPPATSDRSPARARATSSSA